MWRHHLSIKYDNRTSRTGRTNGTASLEGYIEGILVVLGQATRKTESTPKLKLGDVYIITVAGR